MGDQTKLSPNAVKIGQDKLLMEKLRTAAKANTPGTISATVSCIPFVGSWIGHSWYPELNTATFLGVVIPYGANEAERSSFIDAHREISELVSDWCKGDINLFGSPVVSEADLERLELLSQRFAETSAPTPAAPERAEKSAQVGVTPAKVEVKTEIKECDKKAETTESETIKQLLEDVKKIKEKSQPKETWLDTIKFWAF